MGRVWHCGFGLGSLATAVEVTTSSGTLSVQSTVTRPASAGFALRVNPAASTGFVRYHAYATDQAIVGFQRFAVRIDTLPSASTTICRFQDALNNPTGQIRLTTAGKLQLWTAAGAQIGSDSATLTSGDGSWHYIELKIDATGAGALECRADGTMFASGANSAQGQWSRLVIGIIGTNCTADLYFADWALNDSTGSLQSGYPGDGHIIYQRPGSAGDANSWLKTNGTTAGDSSNWQLVDEVTPNDSTDLVTAGVLGAEDMYGVTASGIGSGDTVTCVLVGWRGRNNTADAVTTAKLQIKKTSGGTIAQGSAITPNSASFATNAPVEPRNYTLISHLNPDGGAWTQALLDSMQVGAKITAAGTNRIQITAIWAAVDYLPSAGTSVPLADTASTADTLTGAAAAGPADAGTGVDALTPSAAAPISDSATAADGLTRLIAVPVADVGSSSDALTASSGVPLAEVGASTDTLTGQAAAAAADTASGTDALTAAAAGLLGDTSGAADTATIAASIALADTGTAADTLTTGLPVSLADTAAAADTVTAAAGSVLADTASSADAVAAAAGVSVSDTAGVVDDVAQGSPLVVGDTGTVVDGLTSTAGTPLGDSGSAVDAIAQAAALALGEAAAAVDALLVGAAFALTDTAVAVETVNVPEQLVPGVQTVTARPSAAYSVAAAAATTMEVTAE